MSNENFVVGDTVQLKSGGPIMTIDNIGKFGGEVKARCIWFAGSETKVDAFPLATLVKA